MARTNLGRVVPLHKGDYSATSEYELNDIVSYNGSTYWHFTHEKTTGVLPTVTSVWKLVIDMSGAEPYIDRAETAALQAEGYADDAQSAKTNAETAKGEAETAEQGAVSAAQGALTSAENAGSYMTAAQTAAGNASTSATNADGSAKDAEAWAVGKRNGVDVPGTDPAYHNNAKYYAMLEANKIDANIITNQSITLAQVKTILDEINTNHEHAFFDVSALGASMYLCTIYMDTEKYKIFDLVSGRYTEGAYEASKLLTMCLVNAEPIATQSQIDHLQEEIDELGGVEKIKDWSQLGDLILSGDSTQYISPGDKTDVNWIKSVLGTTTHSHSVSCSDIWRFAFGVGEAEAKDYYFVYDGTNWTYNEEVIDLSDFALTVAGTIETGEVMTITTAVTPENFTFTAYDKFESNETSVPHNWVLESTYASNTKAYDTYESLFVLDEGYTLPAGKYKVHQRYYGTQPFIDVYLTTSQAFTATDEILQFASTGYQNVACIPGSETTYYIASNVRPVYKNSNTYLASNIAIQYNQTGDDWVDISTVEGVRITAAHVQAAVGNNCPAYCNLRQHLNDESANGTYVATHDFDRPSAYNFQKGYLYGIDPRVYALILPTKTKFTAGHNNGDYTQGTTYENVDKVFLLSMKEMSFNIQTSEGNVTDLYDEYTGNVLTNDAVAARAKYNKAGGTLNNYRWSRSCVSADAGRSRIVTSYGSRDHNYAFRALFFAAAFMLGKKSGNQ